jgi:hypothetical protein
LNVFTFIFLVVLVGCSIPLLKIFLDHRRTMIDRAPVASGGDVERQVAALEARVRVLEEIVTDKTYDLRREIDALESQPAPSVGVLPSSRTASV